MRPLRDLRILTLVLIVARYAFLAAIEPEPRRWLE
jgi:hypothetical protein